MKLLLYLSYIDKYVSIEGNCKGRLKFHCDFIF